MSVATWSGGNFQLGAGAITDQMVNSGAAIAVTKLQHAYYKMNTFALKIGDTPVTREDIVHVANSAGTLRTFQAMVNVAPASGNITFDLKKNGSTVLSAVVTIDNTISNRQIVIGTISSPNYNAGDVFSILATISSPTGSQGPAAWATMSESSAP
jgi:hypothetical protein